MIAPSKAWAGPEPTRWRVFYGVGYVARASRHPAAWSRDHLLGLGLSLIALLVLLADQRLDVVRPHRQRGSDLGQPVEKRPGPLDTSRLAAYYIVNRYIDNG